jgi:hypothetical protein
MHTYIHIHTYMYTYAGRDDYFNIAYTYTYIHTYIYTHTCMHTQDGMIMLILQAPQEQQLLVAFACIIVIVSLLSSVLDTVPLTMALVKVCMLVRVCMHVYRDIYMYMYIYIYIHIHRESCLCMHYCDCVSLIIGVGHSAADHGFGQGVYACACMYVCMYIHTCM